MSFGKLTIKEQTYVYLKNKILSGELQQGERINIELLAEELDISNSPIREAVNMLNKDGLIEFETNHGIKVVKLTNTDITEITSAIPILLMGGYRLCIEQTMTAELVKTMNYYLKKQEEYYYQGNDQKFLEFTIKFDNSFVTVSGNTRLTAILTNLTDLFYLVVKDFHSGKRNKLTSITEHKQLLEAIANNKVFDMEQILKRHYKNSVDQVIKNRRI